MIRQNSLWRLFTAVITTCCITPSLFAWQTLTGDIDIHCLQNSEARLDCHYRPLFPGKVSNIHARSGPLELDVKESKNASEDSTAIFFLIDTSDPGRENVIEKNIQQVERLLATSKPSHRLGLASFDSKLRILAPVGSSKSQIISSAENIKAEGRTTELYRSLLLTIEKLSRTNASRKAIYLFSDGQAEDKAYFHADVIRAARNKSVVINSIGFPRSVSLSVALQTLRRLSEETGGSFTEADSNYDLNDKFYLHAYDNVDVGGDFSVNLQKLLDNARSPRADVTLDLATDIGNIKINVPVSLPVINVTALPATAASTVQAGPVQPVIKMVAPTTEPEKIDYWLWYGLPITLVFLFLIALVTLILIYRKQPDKAVFASNAQPQNKPFAYLVTQEEHSKRYPILSTIWRIGRSRDNELSLDDNSVSRLHAEIHRDNNGNFYIMDMQSLNGIYVNNEQVTSEKLQEGDIIEIGDICLRFTQHAEDYQLNDDTAIQKTKMPAH